uniref:Glycosyltransferase RgtA/B/C/D-like domain-containing protein n=1 Tax=Ignisphaera aggregans TaxID=334771 RepID=A0A7J3YTT2_9CREN
MIKALARFASIALLVVLSALVVSMRVINYGSLAENVAYGKTYTLYPGLFTPTMWFALVLIGLLCLAGEAMMRHVATLMIFLWSMIIVLNFLAFGYVVGDQPRWEFALGSLIVSGVTTLERASEISNYFYWPSTWLLEGAFSNITGLSPFEAPVYLMVVTHLLLGLALIVVSRRISQVHDLAVTSLLAYAVLNPYKILHFCPQIYALTLFVLLLAVLLREGLAVRNSILRFILSVAIITSHPLTSLIVAGIACSMSLFSLIKRKDLRDVSLFGLTTLVLFIAWNIDYENFVKFVIMEVLEGVRVQQLPPVAGAKIYEVDTFYKAMALYRYLSLALLSALSLLATVVVLRCRNPLRIRLLAVGVGALTAAMFFNFIPGPFFHRVLYFAFTSMCALTPVAIFSIKGKLQVKRFVKIVLALTLLSLPLLSHVALLEFLTNNNPVGIITSPYETSSTMFIAKHYGFGGYVGVPSGSLFFYVCMQDLNIAKWLRYRPTSSIMSTISVLPLDHYSASKLAEYVYSGEIFIVSPRERFVYYTNTAFNDFRLVDLYLEANYHKIYNNEVFEIMSKASSYG